MVQQLRLFFLHVRSETFVNNELRPNHAIAHLNSDLLVLGMSEFGNLAQSFNVVVAPDTNIFRGDATFRRDS